MFRRILKGCATLALAVGLAAFGASTALAESQTVTATLKLSIPFVERLPSAPW